MKRHFRTVAACERDPWRVYQSADEGRLSRSDEITQVQGSLRKLPDNGFISRDQPQAQRSRAPHVSSLA